MRCKAGLPIVSPYFPCCALALMVACSSAVDPRAAPYQLEATVHGTVSFQSGGPVSGASVHVSIFTAGVCNSRGGVPGFDAKADAQGSFALRVSYLADQVEGAPCLAVTAWGSHALVGEVLAPSAHFSQTPSADSVRTDFVLTPY